MTQEELAVRMKGEEKKLRKSSWAYHLDRGGDKNFLEKFHKSY